MENILYAYKCNKCGKLTHPKRIVCDVCGAMDYSEEPLEGKVTLLTHTHLNNLPLGIDKPFLDFGIVEFENGVRVTGQLELKSKPYAGMILDSKVDTVREINGEELKGFIFFED